MATNSGAAVGASSSTQGSTTLANANVFNNYHFSSFVASEMLVTIVPRFSMPRVDCLGARCGPFEPNYPTDVPLWLALHLRQTDTCTITPPPYLRVAHLQEIVSAENAHDNQFQPLPFYFFEVAKKLCELGSEDIPHVSEVQRLVHEIQALRQRKLKQSMAVFEPEGTSMFIPGIRLTNIISNELHYLRNSYAVVLQQAYEMERRRTEPSSVVRVQPYMQTPVRPTTTTTATSAISETPTSAMVGATQGDDAAVPLTAETATTATTVTTPYAQQQPVKKRRTLRQT